MSHHTEVVEQVSLDAIPDGVVFADESGQVTAMNSAARAMLAVGDGVGKQLADVVALQDQAGNDWFSTVDLYGGPRLRSRIPEQSWFLSDGTELLLTVRIEREDKQGPTTGVVVCLRTSRARERLDRERSDLVATSDESRYLQAAESLELRGSALVRNDAYELAGDQVRMQMAELLAQARESVKSGS